MNKLLRRDVLGLEDILSLLLTADLRMYFGKHRAEKGDTKEIIPGQDAHPVGKTC